MKININTIEKAKEFVSICSKYHDGDILVKQNKYAVDGFYDEIQKWKVENN